MSSLSLQICQLHINMECCILLQIPIILWGQFLSSILKEKSHHWCIILFLMVEILMKFLDWLILFRWQQNMEERLQQIGQIMKCLEIKLLFLLQIPWKRWKAILQIMNVKIGISVLKIVQSNLSFILYIRIIPWSFIAWGIFLLEILYLKSIPWELLYILFYKLEN